ncbi:MAG: hypothetical protein ACJAYX_002603, partial [Planctomycetota bacterium]
FLLALDKLVQGLAVPLRIVGGFTHRARLGEEG